MFDFLNALVLVVGVAGGAFLLNGVIGGVVEFAAIASRPLRLRLATTLSLWFGSRARLRGLDARKASRRALLMLALEDLRLWGGAALLGAVLVFDPARSIAAFTLILMAGVVYVSSRRSYYERRLNADTETLIVQFASRYPLWRSVTRALKDIYQQMPDGELRYALGQATLSLDTGSDVSAAVTHLAALRNPALRQFASALGSIQTTDSQVVLDIFKNLGTDVRNRTGLTGEIRQSLTILVITTRVLQVVFCISLLAAAFMDAWYQYFSSTAANTVLLAAMAVLALISTFYVEKEIEFLENV